MRNLICICCPKGCHLQVDEGNGYTVTGNSCQQGAEYGRNECMSPSRIVTSTIIVRGGEIARCPVKTSRPVPKEKIFDVMEAIKHLKLTAPIKLGQEVLYDVVGSDIVATRTIASEDKGRQGEDKGIDAKIGAEKE